MVQVQVMSRARFIEYLGLSHPEKSIAISIRTPGDNLVTDITKVHKDSNVLAIYNEAFNDTDSSNPLHNGITDEQAINMAKFIRNSLASGVQIDKIIVHCDAGQSRSAGVAAAILKYYTGSDMQIFNNPLYKPNMRCYRSVLESLYSVYN